jgi:hypothetical protein
MRATQSGVALRFPPHSKTRLVFGWRRRSTRTYLDCAGKATAATALFGRGETIQHSSAFPQERCRRFALPPHSKMVTGRTGRSVELGGVGDGAGCCVRCQTVAAFGRKPPWDSPEECGGLPTAAMSTKDSPKQRSRSKLPIKTTVWQNAACVGHTNDLQSLFRKEADQSQPQVH